MSALYHRFDGYEELKALLEGSDEDVLVSLAGKPPKTSMTGLATHSGGTCTAKRRSTVGAMSQMRTSRVNVAGSIVGPIARNGIERSARVSSPWLRPAPP